MREVAHTHGKRSGGPAGLGRRLLIALALNLGITAAEVVGGIVSGSLALLADAAHNASDTASVLIAYIAFRIAQRPADQARSFGFGRVETVGALINLTTLIMIGLYLLVEAGNRLFAAEPQELAGTTMLIVGGIALGEDLLAAWVLRKDLGSLNVKATFLHMIADALATVAVIAAAIAVLTWGQRAAWVDPAATAVIALYIFWHAGRAMRETISVLIDTAPEGFDHDALTRTLQDCLGVVEVHHVHLWRREEGILALEAHLVLDDPDLERATRAKERLRIDLRHRFGIQHTTLEVEHRPGVNHDPAIVPDCANDDTHGPERRKT